MTDIFKDIRAMAAADRTPCLERAVQEGKKVMGYFCSYVPEEVIHAAGFVPYRMRAAGSSGTAEGDVYYSALNCTFVRHCFSKALRGDFSFLDGVVFMNGCDHTRRMYDNWRYAGTAPVFRYMFVAPHLINDLSLEQFRKEIEKFISALEHNFNVAITDEGLAHSIELYNKKRGLLQEIYDLRRGTKSPVKGSEMLALLLAVTAMPVEDAIDLLKKVREACQGRDVTKPGDLRVFFSSGCIEEIEHMELIEECGAIIAADNLCLGARHFNMNVGADKDPVAGLAARYLSHLSCPRMMNDFRKRLEYIENAKRDFGISAMIVEKLKFCDLWGGEMFIYRKDSRRKGFPILALERELYGGGEGQTRTRVQAFFEQVRNRGETGDEMFRTV